MQLQMVRLFAGTLPLAMQDSNGTVTKLTRFLTATHSTALKQHLKLYNKFIQQILLASKKYHTIMHATTTCRKVKQYL